LLHQLWLDASRLDLGKLLNYQMTHLPNPSLIRVHSCKFVADLILVLIRVHSRSFAAKKSPQEFPKLST